MSDKRRNVTFQQKMTKINRKSILGIFDSGVGGFSVFKEIRKKTDADIIYFGDCARAPYGNRSEAEIVTFIKEIVLNLQTQGVTHFVSACNSMSVLTKEKLLIDIGIPQEKYLDMVGAVKRVPFEQKPHVLIVGTKATIASGVYQHILQDKKISYAVFCPSSLAGDIEKGNDEAIKSSIKEILVYATTCKATQILYACTHYPLVDALFKTQANLSLWFGTFVDPAHYIALSVQEWNLSGNNTSLFEASLETDIFKEYVQVFSE